MITEQLEAMPCWYKKRLGESFTEVINAYIQLARAEQPNSVEATEHEKNEDSIYTLLAFVLSAPLSAFI